MERLAGTGGEKWHGDVQPLWRGAGPRWTEWNGVRLQRGAGGRGGGAVVSQGALL